MSTKQQDAEEAEMVLEKPPIADLLDALCYKRISKNVDAAVSWLMMASYGYYKCDMPILSDGMYDWLARFIVHNWDEIAHPHKRFMSHEELRTTSSLELSDGYGADAYPNRVRSAYAALVKRELGQDAPIRYAWGEAK